MNESNECKLCGSLHISSFTKDIVYCSECNNYYRRDVSSDIYEGYKIKIPMPTYFDSKLKVRHHLDFLNRALNMNNIKSILEIGPGNGELTKLIRERLPKVKITVIEPGEGFIHNLKKIPNIHVINNFIEESRLDDKFDLIIMSHVLEHLINPMETLKFVYENLMHINSSIYIDIPNADYELRSDVASLTAPKIHLSFFKPEGIVNLLKKVGFSKERITGNIYATLPHGWIKRQEKLGLYINSKKKRPYITSLNIKIQNRLSLLYSSIFNYYFKLYPEEKQLNIKSSYFNNIAIIATKE